MDINEILLAELDTLYRFALHRTRDEYKAEELVQEICAAVLCAAPKLRDQTRVMPWLWGIAKNVYLRSLNPSPETPLPVEEIEAGSMHLISYATPESEYLRKADAVRVRTALSRLAKMYRDVCILFYLEEKDYNTIAKELDIPLSSVKWRLNQSKIQLKKEMEKMDYMEKGYHKAARLCVSSGYHGHGFFTTEGPDGAEHSLNTLLAQNICLTASRDAKTVTELSSELGVAADYIEDTLENLMKNQTMSLSGNKYRTTFPILTTEEYADIFESNIAHVKKSAPQLLNELIGLEDSFRAVGFYGADINDSTLLPMMTAMLCQEISINRFPVHLLPFRNDCTEWYVLGVTNRYPELSCKGTGMSSCGYTKTVTEYWFGPEGRFPVLKQTEAEVFERLFNGAGIENGEDEAALAALLEKGKITKGNDGYKIAVPVIRREEKRQLTAILAPVTEKASRIQQELLENTKKKVTALFPKHLSEQIPFFAAYLSSNTVDSVLQNEAAKRGINLTGNAANWFVIKEK